MKDIIEIIYPPPIPKSWFSWIMENFALGTEQAPALTAGNWTVGPGWESPIVGPGLIKNADGTGTQTPSTPTTIVAGTTYKVVITLSALSAGSATYTLGGVMGQTLAAATTYTDYLKASTTGKLIITPTSTSRFTISAISIKALLGADLSGTYLPLSQKAAASGVASLDGSSLVVQNPANATATPTASKIPIADGSGKLNTWVDRGYDTQFSATSWSPGDGDTGYVGGTYGTGVGATSGRARVYFNAPGTVTIARLIVRVGVLGTNEAVSVYIRHNNTTDYLISNAVDLSQTATQYSKTDLAIAVVAGDFYEIKIVCPTFATNPTSVLFGGQVWVAQ